MRQNGYNLYELLLVIAILSICTTLAVPKYLKYSLRHKSELIGFQISQTIKLAQLEAIRQSKTVYLCAANYNLNGYLSKGGCMPAKPLEDTNWSEGILVFTSQESTISNIAPYRAENRVKALHFEPGPQIKSSTNQFKISVDGDLNLNQIFNISDKRFGYSYSATIKINQLGYMVMENVQ